METNIYWKTTPKGGLEFLQAFYELSYKKKCQLVEPFLESFDAVTMDRLVRALLQHSPLRSKKMAPVMWERKLSPIAKRADEEEVNG
jgi:hypothetical protein